jgi:CheY-like chemotaxis protein
VSRKLLSDRYLPPPREACPEGVQLQARVNSGARRRFRFRGEVHLMTERHTELSPLVLLAEDDRDSREMYALALELAGFRIVQADTGTQALARVAEESPDVVVTDLNLPDVDGYELCQRWKRDPRTSQIPVVLLTGASFDDELDRARRAGCARVLIKPFPPDHLGRELTEVLAAAGSVRRPPAQSSPH